MTPAAHTAGGHSQDPEPRYDTAPGTREAAGNHVQAASWYTICLDQGDEGR